MLGQHDAAIDKLQASIALFEAHGPYIARTLHAKYLLLTAVTRAMSDVAAYTYPPDYSNWPSAGRRSPWRRPRTAWAAYMLWALAMRPLPLIIWVTHRSRSANCAKHWSVNPRFSWVPTAPPRYATSVRRMPKSAKLMKRCAPINAALNSTAKAIRDIANA